MQENSENNTKIIDRIIYLADYKGDSFNRISQSIGVSNSYFSKMIRSKGSLGEDIISKIKWMITGSGPIFKKDLPVAKSVGNDSNEGIPLIPIDAFAGVATGEVSVLEYECERYIIPMFKDAEFLIPVKGSSMIPKYSSGDIVACKKLNLSDIFFQWNKVYVIDTDQGVLVKRIHKAKDPEHIKVVSENPQYEPFELHLSKVHAIAIVIGVVRLE